jgi:hypothetical protein
MNKILTSLITLLAFTGLQAQPSVETPRLIVGLTIDQLRTDYLEAFSSLYGEKGFKRLWKEAMIIRNVQYGFSRRDRASVIASIYTGTTPSVHGIVGEQWLDVSTLRTIGCVDDVVYMGRNTSEHSSAANLLSSTITDELKVFTQHKAKVYAVSPFRDAAVISAGHAADGAFWVNQNNGKWCSTSYYGDFPFWASAYNNNQAPDSHIASLTWVPTYDVGRYKFLPVWNRTPFKYHFADDRNNKYKLLVTSPLVNDEVNSVAQQIIKTCSVGTDEIPDMLCLTYYGGYYNHQTSNTLELQDTYVKLDKSLASLLDMLDKSVGLQHVMFVISSTGYMDGDGADLPSYRIPQGQFSMKRCAALLNMYLMAIYGNGQYVEGYFGNELYLDHKLIEKKRIDLEAIQDKAASFLQQFTGVNEAYSAHQLLTGAWNPHIDKIRKGYNKVHSGDLFVFAMPGWTMVDEQNNTEKIIRSAYVPSPLIILGGGFKNTIIDNADVDCIAPTISSCLHIRAPNASTVAPLTNNQ